MNVQVRLSAIKQTKWYEYLIRFVFGGLITVAAGLIAKKYGLVIGGLFLAFPSIFPASVTLVQTHQERREEKKGETDEEDKEEKGRRAAAATAHGTVLGAFGLLAFAVVIWQFSLVLPPWLVLAIALVIWFGVAVLAWWISQKLGWKTEEPES